MYSSAELKAMVDAKLKSSRSGTDQTLTGYESSPPATPQQILANAQITTISSPAGDISPRLPWEKIPGYIPVPVGRPQWGMPKETTNWNAAQFSTTQMQFNSPLALSVQQQYDLSAIPPTIYSKGVPNAKTGIQQGSNEKDAEINQGTTQQSSGENVQKVPSEGQKVSGGPAEPMPMITYTGPHKQNAWQWQ